MNATGLPARIMYATGALPAGAAAGFYVCMFLLPRLLASLPDADPGVDGRGIFNMALGVGAVVAFTATLFALTLPSLRHRKRHGRRWRILVSLILILSVSAWFSDMGHRLSTDLLFAVWLSYTVAFTFVRYGVLDQARLMPSTSRRS